VSAISNAPHDPFAIMLMFALPANRLFWRDNV
jgi:hypothetical protein